MPFDPLAQFRSGCPKPVAETRVVVAMSGGCGQFGGIVAAETGRRNLINLGYDVVGVTLQL